LSRTNIGDVGKRKNAPAKGWWFTPGGRVRKHEPLQDALERVAREELGLTYSVYDRVQLMGAWDHFYPDSAFSAFVSTHYVNLPHWLELTAAETGALALPGDDGQHAEWRWLPLEAAQSEPHLHAYVCNYVVWLTERWAT